MMHASDEMGRSLHARLLAGEPDAQSDLAVAYLDSLAGWLIARNPRLDPDCCETAAEDAILALIKNPHTYDPARCPLESYLRMSAGGDLKNLLQKERRHSLRRADLAAVELSHDLGKYVQDADADPA